MIFTWTQSSDIPLMQGVNDLAYTNGTYILVSNTPSGNLGTIALSPIATSTDLIEWTVQKRINPNLKNIRLLTIDNTTYYIGTEQNSVVIYSTEDNTNFTRVRKFHNFITDTSKSRVRKVDTTYVITLLGGFITYSDTGAWNLVLLEEDYKDYYVLDATYYDSIQLLLFNKSQYILASYTNNELTYTPYPFINAIDTYHGFYGLVSNQDQLLILGSYYQRPCILIRLSNGNWVIKQIEILENIFERYEYSLRDGIYINNTWIFVGVKIKSNGYGPLNDPGRILITEDSLSYTNVGNVTLDSTIEPNPSSSVFGLDRIYHFNDKLITLGTGYPNNDKFLLISS